MVKVHKSEDVFWLDIGCGTGKMAEVAFPNIDITSIQVNHYFHKQQKIDALKKCYSALKHNGIYIGFENFLPFTEKGTHLGLERWKTYQLCQGREPKECQEHFNRFGVDYFPITISEHLENMNRAGFDVAELLWVSNLQVGVYGIKY